MKPLIFAVSVALFAGAGAVAFAQEHGQHQDWHAAFTQACGADMQTYCSAAQSRDDRRACMQANKDKFSDACKGFMASHHAHAQMQGTGGGQ
ncbi:MAG: hypothetical protein ACLQUZ_16135 [Rhizomicrobium sp.]